VRVGIACDLAATADLLKNAEGDVGARHGCDDYSNGEICGSAVWEKRSAGSGNDECDQGSFYSSSDDNLNHRQARRRRAPQDCTMPHNEISASNNPDGSGTVGLSTPADSVMGGLTIELEKTGA
jgi:hypothetical protein